MAASMSVVVVPTKEKSLHQRTTQREKLRSNSNNAFIVIVTPLYILVTATGCSMYEKMCWMCLSLLTAVKLQKLPMDGSGSFHLSE